MYVYTSQYKSTRLPQLEEEEEERVCLSVCKCVNLRVI